MSADVAVRIDQLTRSRLRYAVAMMSEEVGTPQSMGNVISALVQEYLTENGVTVSKAEETS